MNMIKIIRKLFPTANFYTLEKLNTFRKVNWFFWYIYIYPIKLFIKKRDDKKIKDKIFEREIIIEEAFKKLLYYLISGIGIDQLERLIKKAKDDYPKNDCNEYTDLANFLYKIIKK